MEKTTARPPVLTRKIMVQRIRLMRPDFPPELIQAAVREIIDGLSSALAEERAVVLRGFGRFTPRRYRGGPKKLGLVFHPSPGFVDRLNKDDDSRPSKFSLC